MPPRDTQRQKVYNAESVLHGKDFPTMAELTAYVQEVTQSAWWKHRYANGNRERSIAVADGRGRRRACAYGSWKISLPKWSRFQTIVLHELAHVLTTSIYGDMKVAPHGREFAKCYLEIVEHYMGKEAHDLLKDSFKKHHVKYVVRKS